MKYLKQLSDEHFVLLRSVIKRCHIRFSRENIVSVIIGAYVFVVVLLVIYSSNLLSPTEHQLGQPTEVPTFTRPIDYQFVLQPEEKEYPLAFSLQVYRDFDRVLRLLHAIFRPNNCYCVHIDAKVNPTIRLAVQLEMQKRYGSNVYVVPENTSVRVRWGTISTLNADLICSRLLLDRCSEWKYWINLTGQEFPMKTNWELVTALKLVNGINIVTGSYQGRITSRLPPSISFEFPLNWYKGGAHVAVRRDFVHFVTHNDRAKQIFLVLQRFEETVHRETFPDETYFPTINFNPSSLPAPGALIGLPDDLRIPNIVRYKLWNDNRPECQSGRWVRKICVLGLGDVREIINRPQFFANKFFPTVEPEGFDWLERWIASKILYEAKQRQLHPSFNQTYYTFAKNLKHI